MSAAELEELRQVCAASMARGGETGSIAADILRASDDVTALINKVRAGLSRVQTQIAQVEARLYGTRRRKRQ